MRTLLTLLVFVITALSVLSAGLLFYNIHIGSAISDVSRSKMAELEEKIAAERNTVKEGLAEKYKKEMDAFAEVAENLKRIRQKEEELERAIKNKMDIMAGRKTETKSKE